MRTLSRLGMLYLAVYSFWVLTYSMLFSFDETREKILANGGRITNNLNDPKLTHVVLDDRDRSRRIPLMRATEL